MSEGKTNVARITLADLAPGLDQAQLDAIRAGLPIPPSAAWLAAHKQKLTTTVSPLSEPDLPRVSGIMAFSDPAQRRIAQKSVNQFVAQTYPNKQLVIANASGVPITTAPHDEIKELLFDGPYSIGALRNLAIEHAGGDWLMQWDADDYFHPDRITFQMLARRPGQASMLMCQVRVHCWRSIAYLHRDRSGIPNTILFPRSPARYRDADTGEDAAFVGDHWSGNSHAIPNVLPPYNGVSVAVYHDRNAMSADVFMVGHSGPEFDGRWELGPAETEHLRSVLVGFNFEVHRPEAAS